MGEIRIKNVNYYCHPIYDLYAASVDGNVVNIINRVPMRGFKKANGYMICSVRGRNQKSQKAYQVHRFVWECLHSIIPDGLVIDHKNDIKDDNRLCNLQIITQKQNCKKSARNRDYSFVANIKKTKEEHPRYQP